MTDREEDIEELTRLTDRIFAVIHGEWHRLYIHDPGRANSLAMIAVGWAIGKMLWPAGVKERKKILADITKHALQAAEQEAKIMREQHQPKPH